MMDSILVDPTPIKPGIVIRAFLLSFLKSLMSKGKVIEMIKKKWLMNTSKFFLTIISFCSIAAGKNEDINAQTKAIKNIFRIGTLLKGRILPLFFLWGTLYKVEIRPKITKYPRLSIFNKGIWSSRMSEVVMRKTKSFFDLKLSLSYEPKLRKLNLTLVFIW